MTDALNLIGRVLIALLFIGGAIQKLADPGPVAAMIAGTGLPAALIWPLAAANLVMGLGLILGPGVRGWAVALALYCIATSWFTGSCARTPGR